MKTQLIISNKSPADVYFGSTPFQKVEEEAQDEVDQSILDEINVHIYGAVDGFYEKYFLYKPWSSSVEQSLQATNPMFIDGRWSDHPETSSRSVFIKWFSKLQSTFCQGRSRFRICSDSSLDGSDHQDKLDLFLVLSEDACREEYNCDDVQVVGVFHQGSANKYLQGLLHLYRHAREVFTSQPTRLFLHGFYIFGSMMELWLFDRAGLYSSEAFNIHENPDRFTTIIAGYTMMSDRELGINTLSKRDDETEPERLYLEQQPLAFPRRVVSQGPTCYKAKRLASKEWELVVKFSWRSDKTLSKKRILKVIKQRKVWGIVQLFGYQQLDAVTELRRGLRFGVPFHRKSYPPQARHHVRHNRTPKVFVWEVSMNIMRRLDLVYWYTLVTTAIRHSTI